MPAAGRLTQFVNYPHIEALADQIGQQGYYPGGEGSLEVTASKVVNSPEDAADYIDLLMTWMPYDTAEILDRIKDAERRKVVCQKTMAEQASDGQA
jgi:hypothetical protein